MKETYPVGQRRECERQRNRERSSSRSRRRKRRRRKRRRKEEEEGEEGRDGRVEEGEAASPLSRKPDVGLHPRTLGS